MFAFDALFLSPDNRHRWTLDMGHWTTGTDVWDSSRRIGRRTRSWATKIDESLPSPLHSRLMFDKHREEGNAISRGIVITQFSSYQRKHYNVIVSANQRLKTKILKYFFFT
ncbi:hypothetical protein M5D96_006624 [Drosophila gunungcola]|uniref:Uncharacterized protein n=1 Tax=Drosophila gunungcola TaxID=103775 RepID=A0A9P9YPG8_9MUSC|nr:hypothetical protein M5D96_006624 [Drosophila gunungcola]